MGIYHDDTDLMQRNHEQCRKKPDPIQKVRDLHYQNKAAISKEPQLFMGSLKQDSDRVKDFDTEYNFYFQ